MNVPPPTYDLRRGIRKWGMLGNGDDGDCVIAAFFHILMVRAVAAASSWKKLLYRVGFTPPTAKQAIALYAEYLATLGEKPGPTTGVVATGFLNWAQSKGLIAQWSELTVTDEATLHTAMIAETGIMLTMNLTNYAYRHFDDPVAWSIRPGDTPNPSLAHAVALVAYGPENDAYVSWGRVKSATRQFTQDCLVSAFTFS